MQTLEKMRKDAAVQMDLAQRRWAGLDAIEHCFTQLKVLGFDAVAEMDDCGCFVLRVDPDKIEARDGPKRPEPAEGAGRDQSTNGKSPVPSISDLSARTRALVADMAQAEAEDPEPVPTEAEAEPEPVAAADGPAPQDNPDLVTGRWSPEEEQQLIAASLDGAGPTPIARALNRNVKDVANKKFRLKNRIDAARLASRPAPKRPKRSLETPKPAKPDPKTTEARKPRKRTVEYWSTHLEGLGCSGTWTPQRDLALVASIARGTGVAGAGAILKIGSEDAHVRWKQIKGASEKLTEENMATLIEALQARAAV